MTKHIHKILLIAGLLMEGVAHAQTLPPQRIAAVQVPAGGGIDGPFFPAEPITPVRPSTGSDLKREAQTRLETGLGANSVFVEGSAISKTQAQRAGQGYIAKNFDSIDTAHTGSVTLAQVRSYIATQKK